MMEITYPFFKRDRVLKSAMLENFRDYPRDVLDVYNERLSDGLVCGLTPIVDEDIITFTKGIIKYRGQLYVINAPVPIQYSETEVDVVIKLNFYDEIQDHDYRKQYVDIEIDRQLAIGDNQIELGRFKLKKGAYLRSNYQDLYDFTTEYNTINVVHVMYAGYGEPTLSSLILKYFARAALATRTQDPMDISFCLLCLNSDRIEREAIRNYINYKLEQEQEDMSNERMHHYLVVILDEIKRNNSGLNRRRAARSKIIVD